MDHFDEQRRSKAHNQFARLCAEPLTRQPKARGLLVIITNRCELISGAKRVGRSAPLIAAKVVSLRVGLPICSSSRFKFSAAKAPTCFGRSVSASSSALFLSFFLSRTAKPGCLFSGFLSFGRCFHLNLELNLSGRKTALTLAPASRRPFAHCLTRSCSNADAQANC